MRPGRESLESILRRCGIHLERAQLDRIWTYHGMLREANARLNLTRIHNFENMVLKHYVDSLLVLKFVPLPSPLIDMGSGPGLPGIPLKIASPDTHVILSEPRGARVSFLGEVCERLGLDGVEVYPHKLGPDYPGTVQGVISRAVAEIPETLDRVAACLAPGGRMLFMKGPECDDEIARAGREHAGLFRLEADHAYEIPGTEHRRRLVVYERLDGEAPGRRGRTEPEPAFRGPAREVSSESNPSFRLFRDLLAGRGIRKHGQAIVAGNRIIGEVLVRYPGRAIGWISPESGPPPPETASSLTWFRLAPPLYREIDVAGTNSPLLLVEAPPLPAWSDEDEWPEGCTLFIPFQDPENVGAVIRSAAAFGASRVVLLREAAHPFHPRSSRAAGTALFQVPLLQGPSIHDLASAGVPLIALDTSGPELSESPWPPRFGLVVGLEGPGLPEPLRGGPRRRIAIRPDVESLNAATAAAVALHAIATQRRAE
ncbi:Ribosomal RNA small subunit methyltransferase G [Aquisphaera giovannonii]|uniref:Ribosomal RNA small subunit methyltransferase G n=1 Tax=Aquisphaera giovannonii TaxID=406548 RepID=A0A5B9WCB6_9BACT|nr:16S rRNA (guanine(527)-N(7))-methyltransferase RsmG [Aquisphaera giovannonii]QEH37530.1 Ribosomal RNA small subunit methyltransferase G [Aquisphaera giovannonii]